MMAIKWRNISLVDRLLACEKIDLGLCDGDSETALLRALNQPDMLHRLLQAKADPDAQDADCKTALMRAIEKKDHSMMKMLLDAGADVSRQDEVSN